MYANKRRSKVNCGYFIDIIVTIVTILLLALLMTTFVYKEIIGIKYLKYLMMVLMFFGSYISSAVTKSIYGEDSVKFAVATVTVLGVVIVLCGITKQGSGGDVKTAVMNFFSGAAGKIIPNVIKSAHKNKRSRR